MLSVRARVRNGRLLLDEPTDLPDGSEVELEPVLDDAHDRMDDVERARLHKALSRSAEEIKQGRFVDGDEFLKGLRSQVG